MADSLENSIHELMTIIDVNHDEAKALLLASNNNTQIAVHTYLESQSQHQDTPEEESIRAPIPQVMEQLLPSKQQYGAGPSGLRTEAPRLIVDSLRDFAEETKLQERLLRENGTLAMANDSKSKYTKTLGLLFRPPYDLMFSGSFEAACNLASQNKKWLLVNIHNPEEFASQLVNRDLWSNDKVKEMVKSNFILWLVSNCSQDGTKYRQFYPVENWPYISILDPVTRGKLVDLHTSDAEIFVNKCKTFIAKYDPTSDDWRKPTGKRRCLSEEEELQKAIQASLIESTVEAMEGTQDYSDEESDTLETFESSDSEIDYSLPKVVQPPEPTQPHLYRKIPRHSVIIEDNSNNITCTIIASSQQSTSVRPQQTSTVPHQQSMNISPQQSANVSSEQASTFSSQQPTSVSSQQASTFSSQQPTFVSSPSEESSSPKGANLSLRIKLPNGQTKKTEMLSSFTISSLLGYIGSIGCPIDRHRVLAMYPRRVISECPLDQTLEQAGIKLQEMLYVEEVPKK